MKQNKKLIYQNSKLYDQSNTDLVFLYYMIAAIEIIEIEKTEYKFYVFSRTSLFRGPLKYVQVHSFKLSVLQLFDHHHPRNHCLFTSYHSSMTSPLIVGSLSR